MFPEFLSSILFPWHHTARNLQRLKLYLKQWGLPGWLVFPVWVPWVAAAKSLQSCPTLCDPHRRQPTRLPCPWDSPGKNLEWVAISSSNAWKWKVKGKSLSRVRLFATPWTTAYQAPLSMGFSRQEYWSGVPLPSPVPMGYCLRIELHLRSPLFSVLGKKQGIPCRWDPGSAVESWSSKSLGSGRVGWATGKGIKTFDGIQAWEWIPVLTKHLEVGPTNAEYWSKYLQFLAF